MAKVRRKRLAVDPIQGVDGFDWYMINHQATQDGLNRWLAEIDAGNHVPFNQTTEPETEIPQVEGDYDFAVVQTDSAGNESDPASFPAWVRVPLDTTPPPPATGGVITDWPDN